ncbi:GAF domain-containing sensor histidine kinase [Longispora sp. K20-0274]|uniref:sensor histidine kinase n=1 Tax=Longispora sp. K20-0274 TaxID=3088255 RepID=UPI0039999A07
MTTAVRIGLLVLVTILSWVATGDPRTLVWIGLLTIAALPATLRPTHPVYGRAGRAAETIVTVLGAVALADEGWTLLPYLLAPVMGAALYRGAAEAFLLVAMAGIGLFGLGSFTGNFGRSDNLLAAVQWLAISTATAAFGGALHRALATRNRPQPYAEATRLLTQLRTVARHLPGGTLDPGGIASHMLDEVREAAGLDRAAVFGASGGGRLVVLAQFGVERVDWETSVDSESAVADAWATQQPQTSARSLSRSRSRDEVSALVVPLMAGVRTIGLLALENDTPGAYPAQVVARVAELAGPAALRLEAALLFDEVRTLATSEERQRLAREIHDGVAQELVMVGYGIDNALAQLPPGSEGAENDLKELRTEVTRVITELRLSLFELRSEVERHGGLAAAISDYARTIGSSAGLRVHLSLDESTSRLPAAIEGELLRIAQEAITNARKHARAENLWVTCEVDPPYARIEVSDDGAGIGDGPADGSYGLAIMAERAERIRGDLTIAPRDPRGTTVVMVLGTAVRHGSVSASEGVGIKDE